MKIPFTEYLHGGKESGYDLAEKLMVDHDLDLTDAQIRNLAGTFYEVTLNCEYDTDTNAVVLVSAEL